MTVRACNRSNPTLRKEEANIAHQIFEFGSIYLGDMPQRIPQNPCFEGDIPSYTTGSSIRIGHTVEDKKISWVKPDGMSLLIADRVLLSDVSWMKLYFEGLICGTKVQIDGQRFLCRSLSVFEKNTESEWDKALKIVGNSNDIWHWDRIYSWSQNTDTGLMSHKCGYGYRGAKHILCFFKGDGNHTIQIGFRPILEILPIIDVEPNCTLDGQDFQVNNFPGSKNFYPILQPTDKDAFGGIPNGTTLRMYTVLKNGKPVRMDTNRLSKFRELSKLRLVDKYYGDEYLVPWVVSNGIAVASRALLQPT